MNYQVTKKELSAAQTPHHIFNVNVLVTHLFAAMLILELGETVQLLLIPLASSLVVLFLYYRKMRARTDDTWFVAAHWTIAWRRGRILLFSYVIAISMIVIYTLINIAFPGGLSMNNFSTDGAGQTNLGEIITIYFSAITIFVAILITFMQTGISVYDAGKGIVDSNIETLIPRDENSNKVLPMSNDEITPDRQYNTKK